MRLYNGKTAQLTIPLTPSQNLTVKPKSVSTAFLASTDFINLVMRVWKTTEVAIIPDGTNDLAILSKCTGAGAFTVNSLEEAIERLTPAEVKKPVVAPEVKIGVPVSGESKDTTAPEEISVAKVGTTTKSKEVPSNEETVSKFVYTTNDVLVEEEKVETMVEKKPKTVRKSTTKKASTDEKKPAKKTTVKKTSAKKSKAE